MSALLRSSRRIVHFIDSFTETFGRVISWLNIALMLSVFAVVLLRYVLNMGSIALQELAIYIHAIIFLSACGYTLRHNGHVRVDIFYRRFSPRTRGIVDSLGSILFLLPVCLFIGFISWDYVDRAWDIRETSHDPGGLPAVYLLKSLILVLVATLVLQGVAEFLKAVDAIVNPQQNSISNNELEEAA
ncbi:TRAP transporter small permease subunit [Sansalvadorimonas sp. 2012CJ34-2]|uniref:TRAP transporter small permease protein n=1 Tax=Parendozoicomonas callyspongiae TaxID=2942213 RepID=A0ABT0PB16_9GAMM|nr:TRAP transporter small permease subunit [Sansalvadorimonas sp. 2012CJ34-2]MCL6268396.1 TRAP transporter small permease subunit [Sansalvadorimonas sp. 2012CJ34-2]